jgi:hypothetical protein
MNPNRAYRAVPPGRSARRTTEERTCGHMPNDPAPMPSIDGDGAPEQDDTTDQAAPAPVGKIKGDAARVLDAIIRARLPLSIKDILLVIYHRTYTMRVDDPQWGWVRINQQELATEFHTQKSDISTRLNRLVSLHIIHRPGYARLASLRDPNDWQSVVFDWGDAQAKHTRAGAGAPPIVRPQEPMSVPVEDRVTDTRGRFFTTRETVVAHVIERGGTDDHIDIHWRVVDYFQTAFDQYFKPEFLQQLTDALEKHTSATMIAKLAEARADPKVKAPWGWLLTCLDNAPKPTPQEDKPHVRRDARVRPTRNASVSVATGDTDDLARFVLEADDEDDDTDLTDVHARTDATATR